VFESYSEAHRDVSALSTALSAFVASPSETTLEAAKQAWLDSRPEYLQTEAYRFYGGPIDDDDNPEARINAWPLDEAYVDYVDGDPEAGLINDPVTMPTIDEASVTEVNMVGGEANVASGFHAVEFLLWGQDLSATGPGERSHTDYLASGAHANAERRGEYLTTVGALMIDDIAGVRDDWSGAYKTQFLALPAAEALGLVLKGIGSLSGAELSGERMQVAYDTKSQEDEHSCFSDNTHVDHLNDQVGIENVYLGRFGDTDGPGIDDLVRARNPALDDEMKQRISDAKAKIQAIPQPFDQAILGDDSADGRVKIKAAIDALKAQTETIAKIAKLLGVELNLE
jgi:putative iron-regulated protein